MEFIEKARSIERKNSEVSVVTEYPNTNKQLNFAIVNITGQYPENGYAKNLVANEIIYVQAGEGSVTVNGEKQRLQPGDVILIEANEHFVWEGNLQLHIACHPPFIPDQHVVIV